MDKSLTCINKAGEEVSVLCRCNALTILKYQTFFKRNFLTDINEMVKAVGEDINLAAIDIEVFYRLIYIMAKSADKSLPDFETWFESFDSIDIADAFENIIP